MVKSALWAAFVAAAPLARPMDAGCRQGFGGVNLVVYDENVQPNRNGEGNAFIASDELPALPSATLQSSYGVESACHYNGTIVLAGSSPFSGSFAEEGRVQRQAQEIFIDWLNQERGGVQIGNERYGMRITRVDDASRSVQVTNATVHAYRPAQADFVWSGVGSDMTQWAAMQADADHKLMVAGGVRRRIPPCSPPTSRASSASFHCLSPPCSALCPQTAHQSCFSEHNFTFGFVSPGENVLRSAMLAIASAAGGCAYACA